MRTFGTHIVILNSKVYYGMSVERKNERYVQLTGMEDGVARVFLVHGSPKDADALYCALKSRLAELKPTPEDEQLKNAEKGKSIDEQGDKSSDTNDSTIVSEVDDGVSSSKKAKVLPMFKYS